MAFIEKEDFKSAIRGNVLDNVTGFDDARIDEAVKFAIDYAKGHLNARYDTVLIFSQTGSARSTIVLNYCIDIAIYKLHALISPRKMPKHRRENYLDALDWFDDVKEGKIN